jgi:hypothetical protein
MGLLAVIINALIAREGIDVLSQTIETSSSEVGKSGLTNIAYGVQNGMTNIAYGIVGSVVIYTISDIVRDWIRSHGRSSSGSD